MDRKKFLKNAALSAAALTIGHKVSAEPQKTKSTYDKLMQQVGFNHLPNSEIKTMKSVYHKAETRGHANHGWLDSHHSFSFANYYNPERMNFGVLRVLNDDRVNAGRGFGMHPHDNMEIISIPLDGDLEHKDSMGNTATIKEGDIQVMSAGTGIKHSEYNRNKDKLVKFLQIWVFPNKKDVTPRYDQISLDKTRVKNRFHQILSPNPDDEGVWIHQNAWFNLGDFDAETNLDYELNNNTTGVYAFLISGKATIEGQELNERDGFGVWDTSTLHIKAEKGARVLLMEVPMAL